MLPFAAKMDSRTDLFHGLFRWHADPDGQPPERGRIAGYSVFSIVRSVRLEADLRKSG
jgi:hypothetical protein